MKINPYLPIPQNFSMVIGNITLFFALESVVFNSNSISLGQRSVADPGGVCLRIKIVEKLCVKL